MSRPLLILTGLPAPALNALSRYLGCLQPTGNPKGGGRAEPYEACRSRLAADASAEAEGAAILDQGAVWHLASLSEDFPEVRVVAGYQAPWDALETLFKSDTGADSEQVLDDWCRYHECLLDWRNRYPDRCLLFQVDRVRECWPQLIESASSFAGREAKAPFGEAPAHSGRPRAALFATLLDRLSPRALEIYSTLEACASLFGREPEFTAPLSDGQADLAHLLGTWASSVRLEAEAPGLRRAQAEAERKSAQLDQTVEQLSGMLDARSAQLAQLDQLSQQRQGELQKLQRERVEAAEQAAQLRKEIESLRTKAAESAAKADESAARCAGQESQLATLVRERDAQAQAAVQQEARAKDLAAKLKDLGAKLKDLEGENELTLLQLHQTQEELEQYFLASKEGKERAEALAREKDALSREKEALCQEKDVLSKETARIVNDLKARVDALAKARDEQAQLVSASEAQARKLAAERDAQSKAVAEKAKLAAELQGKLDALARVRDEQANLVSKGAAEKAKLIGDLQAKLDAVGKARDEQARLAAERQAELGNLRDGRVKQLEAEVAGLRAQAKEFESENELTLLQLHQVQEELEQYFMAGQQQDKLLKDYSLAVIRAREQIERLKHGREQSADSGFEPGDALKAYQIEVVELEQRCAALEAELDELGRKLSDNEKLVAEYERELRRALDLVDRQEFALSNARLGSAQLKQQLGLAQAN